MTDLVPSVAPDQVPEFEKIDFTVTEQDSIRRQASDAEGWYRGAVPYHGRP